MIKFKLFSRYDETDSLKVSQDSSILNKEEKGKMSSGDRTGLMTGAGAILGAAGSKGGSKMSKIAGGTKGALIGAAIGTGMSVMSSMNKKRKDDNFYNSRLREAQRAAKRREKIDWNTNVHGRANYS